MGQYGINTRRWLEITIKQRKLLVNSGRSHKPQNEVIKALRDIELILGTYSFQNDLYMARFIRQHLRDIETIIPGKGSTSREKRERELQEINKAAILIIEGQQAGGNGHREETLKMIEYEKTI